MALIIAPAVTDRAKRLVRLALQDDFTTTKEHVQWDVYSTVFPDPSAGELLSVEPGADPSQLALLPVVVIYLEIEGAEPGAPIYLATILPPYRTNAKTISKRVKDELANLRQFREDRKLALALETDSAQ